MKFVPVDSDPFATATPTRTPKLVPVDNDPFAAAQLHDRPAVNPPAFAPPLLHDRPPLTKAPTTAETIDKSPFAGQAMSQGQQAGGPLVQAMLNPDLPAGARAVAGAGHVVKNWIDFLPKVFWGQAERERTGQPLTPQDAGDVLQAAAGAEGLRFHEGMGAAPKPVEAPAPRIEPPPLNETRAREAGVTAVGKVADRLGNPPAPRLTPSPAKTVPVNYDPFAEWKATFETPEGKKGVKAQWASDIHSGEHGVSVDAKGRGWLGPDKQLKPGEWGFKAPKGQPSTEAKAVAAANAPKPPGAPPVQPAAPAVPKPKKAASPKIKPTIPPGTAPHVAKMIEKGNNFFADQAKVQPPTTLSMTPAARVKRAKQLGFNTGLTLYHGTSKDFTEFDVGKAYGGEYAIFTSDKPGISANYGGKHVLPLWGKFENPKTIENFGNYSNSKVKAAIAQAKAEGYTELILKGMQDIGGKQTQYLFFKPENLRARDAAVFDPKKTHEPNLLSAAAPNKSLAPSVAIPDPDIKGTVKNTADKLYATERKHDAAKLEALQHVKDLPPEAARLAEKFFKFLEPGPNKPTLTAEEKVIFDKYLKPWLQEQHDLYEEIKKLKPDLLPKDYDPDYVHHLVQGKTPEFDEEIGVVTHEPNSPWFGSKTLPRSTRSLKNSKYYVREDEYGTREVVSIDDKGNMYSHMGKTKTNIPPHTIKGEVAPGETVSIAGKKWTIKRASVAEKEGATNLKYYKNAYLSTISNVVRLKKVAEALKFFEQQKYNFQHDPQVMPLARWPGDKRPIPKDFRATTLPGWEGWKFEPRIAEAMDDWHNKPGEPFEEAMKNIVHGVVGTLFMLPFRHIGNVAGHYYVGRVGDALAYPGKPGVPFRHVGAALWDVFRQGKMTRDMLNKGSALQLTKVLTADFNKQLLKGLEKNFKDNPKEWSWLFKKLGVNPVDIYSNWLKASSVAMWYASDVMMQALVRERMERGLSLEDAIASAEKDIPSYRVNSRVIMDNQAGRAMSRYLQNSLFSVFGRYNNNKWRAIADMVNDVVKGGDPGTRKEGVAKALALISWVAIMAYPMTAAIQSMTGKKDKRASAIGPADPIDKLKQFGELVAPQTMRRLGASDDNVHAVQLLQSLIELSPLADETMTQLTGRNPYTGQSVNTPGERLDSAVEMISPLQMATEMATGKTSLLEQALKSTIGMRNVPKPTPAWVERRDQKAADKYESQHPFVHKFNQLGRKLQPFTPDAIVNRFLPSSSP